MKILLVSPTIYALPPTGYSGTEMIVTVLSKEYQKAGHQVAVMAPEGSTLPEGTELLPVPLRCQEEAAHEKHKERYPEFDIIHDHTFGSWVYLSSIGVDPPLPIVKTFHTDPSVWLRPPPIQHPCLVGISRNHARRLAMHLGITCEYVYNGIDLELYKPPPDDSKRNGRLLFLGRYTNEKGPLEAMVLAKRLRMPLDCYGDMEIVNSPEYIDRCRREADGVLVRVFPGVSRERTVELYQTYRALVYTPNWSEPFGLVLAEAQACGLPVVTLERGSMPEVVKDGVSGYVCDDIAQMEQVLKDGCLSRIKTEDSVAWAAQFSVQKMAIGYLNLFDRLRRGDRW